MRPRPVVCATGEGTDELVIQRIANRVRASILQSMQESLRRRDAAGRDFLKHLTTEKLDDWTVYANLPQVIMIGHKGRSLYIKALPIKMLRTFQFHFGDLLIEFGRYFDGMEWLTSEEVMTKSRVAKMADKLTLVLSNSPDALNKIDGICRSCLFGLYENRKWRRRSWRRYWRTTVGVDEILMIFFAMWCLNYEAQKKTVGFLLERIGELRSATPLPRSLQRISGLSGKSVTPLYPSSVFASGDTPKTPTSTSSPPKAAEG